MKKTLSFIAHMALAITSIICFTSCANDSYTKAIPKDCTAIMAIEPKLTGQESGNTEAIASMLNIDDISKCGLDISQKIYLFETGEGYLGACLKVNDSDNTEEWLKSLNTKGLCSKTTKNRDFTFALLNDGWEIGYSDDAFIMLGPILPAQQAEAIRILRKYLKQEDKDHTSPLLDKLNETDGAITLVAQIDALPDKIAAPFTLVQPQKSDCSQIILAASMDKTGGKDIIIRGKLFSFNQDIDKEIKANLNKLNKTEGYYAYNIPNSSLCSIFLNTEGKDLVTMCHNSKQIGSILAGINTAIDMDNILRCTKGDFALSIDSYTESSANMSIAAKLANRDFLKDVSYWKKSCPSGCSIEDNGKDRYKLTTSDISFWFGATTDDFFGSTDESQANSILKRCRNSYSNDVVNEIKGKKLALVINTTEILKQARDASGATGFLSQLLGNVRDIVFSIE